MDTKNIPTVMLGIRDELPGWELIDPEVFVKPKHLSAVVMDCYWIVIDGRIAFRKVNGCLDVIFTENKQLADKIAGRIRLDHHADVEVKQFDILYIPSEYMF